MSGICGIVRFGGDPRGLDEITRMTAAMAFRGPDGMGHWQDETAALGHCLLRTTEEAADERQPLASDDGSVVLVIDGTLWNADELRADLIRAGARLRSRADSELVLRSYETWGRDFLSRVDGDFALAIWDRRRRELYCARDRIGMRPFHWHYSPRCGFCFGSDPEALLALTDMPRRLNEVRIADALVGGLESYDNECTFYLDIERLPPAHDLTVTPGGVKRERYWTFAPPKVLKLGSDAAYEEAFRSVVTEAVRRRLRGSRMTGSMLSGGVDSATVSAIARRIRTEDGTGPHPTFSAVGPDPNLCNETRAIHASAPMKGLAPHFVDHSSLGDLADTLVELALCPSNPFDTHMTLVRAVYFAAQRSGVRAVLDGVGADSVLNDGGVLAYLLRRGRLLTAVREAQGPTGVKGLERPSVQLARALRAVAIPEWARTLRRQFWSQHVDSAARVDKSFIRPDFARRTDICRRFADMQFQSSLTGAPGSPGRRAAIALRPGVIAARERYERQAARIGIEARDPYLDLCVVRFGVSLPVGQVTRKGWPKFILRRAMRSELPEAVLWRPERTHLGWHFSASALGLAACNGELSGAADRGAPYIEMDRLRSEIAAYASGDEPDNERARLMLSALCLAHWLGKRSKQLTV